jgi:predicted nucleic acid-binding protein
MSGDESRILIDTNILIYATLENDSRFARSREVLLAQDDRERFVSVQNLAEMYPNLTGPKMEKPDDPATALLRRADCRYDDCPWHWDNHDGE